ncbi:MAG: TonB-dependent receptor [Halioglobus sp.]
MFAPRALQLGTTALATVLAVSASTAIAQDPEAGGSRYDLVLEEVLVTAQKREQSNMTVPISVDAFTAQDIINTGATDIGEIDDFMPGVEIDSGQTTQTGIRIRGVRSPNISSGQDPSIATFYNNAYMPRAVTTIPLVDLQRVEVLKGPQGTLFGRNATVGVINIIPERPNHDEFEGYVSTRIGNYDLLRLEGMVNAAINDDVAFRANLFHHQRDGITKNLGIGPDLQDQEFLFGRAALSWNLGADTNLLFSADFEDRDGAPSAHTGVSKYAESTDPFSGETTNDVIGREETREMYGVSIQVEHAFNDRLSVFGITSYREWDTTNLQDEDGTSEPRRYLDSNNIEESDIWYNEVRFNFVDDRFDLVFGANYSQEDVYQRTDIGVLADAYMQFVSLELLPEIGLPSDPDVHAWDPDVLGNEPTEFWLDASALAGSVLGNDGIAVLPPSFAGTYFTETMDNTGDFVNWGIFADLSYDVTETLTLIGGLRYSYDEKDYSWQTFEQDLDWPFAPARVAYDPAEVTDNSADFYNKFEDDENWSKVTGRLIANWQFHETAMTYLSVATGYKSGGFDGQVFSGFTAGPFDQEDMTSYEWGVKGDFFDDTLRIEASLFYHELDGRQGSESTKDSPEDPTAQPTIVTSDEETTGFEIIATWQPLDELQLAGLTTTRDTERVQEMYFDAKGEPRGGEPENLKTQTDYTLRLDWTPNIPVGYLLVHVDYVFNEADDDSSAAIFTTGPWYFQDREELSARIAWSNENDTIEVALWGKNLLDKERASNPGGFVADTLGAYKTTIEDPMTYGVDLRYSF